MRLVLASASPRRRELLTTVGLEFEVRPADVDESWSDGEDPRSYVERVARMKAEAAWDDLGATGQAVVLAADTTVDLDGAILAKPVDEHDARVMLTALSGRDHRVHTAVVARSESDVVAQVVTTMVTFIELDDAAIDRYLAIGEHLDKAGAYGMQSAGGALVRSIAGSPSNVIGLPLAETLALLGDLTSRM